MQTALVLDGAASQTRRQLLAGGATGKLLDVLEHKLLAFEFVIFLVARCMLCMSLCVSV